MKNLHLVYTGFNWKERLVEDHEILFLVWEDTQDIMEQVKKKSAFWKWVHIDVVLKISQIDWYEIDIRDTSNNNARLELYFGYMWAESKDRYIEDHEFVFCVAEDVIQAKQQLKNKCTLWEDLHVDFMKTLEHISPFYISLNKKKGQDQIEKVLWYTLLT